MAARLLCSSRIRSQEVCSPSHDGLASRCEAIPCRGISRCRQAQFLVNNSHLSRYGRETFSLSSEHTHGIVQSSNFTVIMPIERMSISTGAISKTATAPLESIRMQIMTGNKVSLYHRSISLSKCPLSQLVFHYLSHAYIAAFRLFAMLYRALCWRLCRPHTTAADCWRSSAAMMLVHFIPEAEKWSAGLALIFSFTQTCDLLCMPVSRITC